MTSATVPVDPSDDSTPARAGDHKAVAGSAREWRNCLLIVILGILAFAVDVPLSRWMVERPWPRPIHQALQSIEPFGQPVAVISVALAVLLCAGPGRGVAFRILANAFGSGLLVDLLKITIARTRPRHFNFGGSVFDTFHSFLPGASSHSHIQSWPSGHTATAVGFCLALSTIFPRGRWLFMALAALVALQRIESGSHYLSDTLFSTAVAYGVWIFVFGRGPVGRFFTRLEARWARIV